MLYPISQRLRIQKFHIRSWKFSSSQSSDTPQNTKFPHLSQSSSSKLFPSLRLCPSFRWSRRWDHPPVLLPGHGRRGSDDLMVTKKWWFVFNMAVGQNLVPLVNIKIAGKWMFIPLKMVLYNRYWLIAIWRYWIWTMIFWTKKWWFLKWWCLRYQLKNQHGVFWYVMKSKYNWFLDSQVWENQKALSKSKGEFPLSPIATKCPLIHNPILDSDDNP
jgi:hypothetical protein